MLSPYETPAQVSAKNVFKTIALCEGHGLNPVSLLRKYGLFALRRNQWCSLQTNLNMLQEIQDHVGELSMTEMGRKTAELLYFPRAVNTIHKAFLSLNHVYHTNHQGNAGSYEVVVLSPYHIQVIAQTPYPCDFQYGLCWGIAQRFLPAKTAVQVERARPLCSQQGQTRCIYDVRWEMPQN